MYSAVMIEVFKFFPFTLLPWSIEVAFAAIIFYAAGNLYGDNVTDILRRIKHKNIIIRLLIFLTLAGLTLLCSLVTQHISYGSDRLGDHPGVLYFGAFTGILLIFMLSNEISQGRCKSIAVNIIVDFIKWIGKNSFRFMAVHVPIKGFFTVIVAKLFHTTTKVVGGSILYSAVVFLITLLITSVITVLTDVVLRRLK